MKETNNRFGVYNQNRNASFSQLGVGAKKVTQVANLEEVKFKGKSNPNMQTKKMKRAFDLGISDRVPEGETRSLFDFAKIGDIVDYDAGKWTQREIDDIITQDLYGGDFPIPSTFFGFRVGYSKNDNVRDCGLSNSWRVMLKTIDENDNKYIVLIHSGILELFDVIYDFNDLEEGIANRNWNAYVNPNYAMYASPLTKKIIEEWYSIIKRTNVKLSMGDNLCDDYNLFDIGVQYALCEKIEPYGYIVRNGKIDTGLPQTYGIRIVVTLKNDIQTVGKNLNGAWELVPSTK